MSLFCSWCPFIGKEEQTHRVSENSEWTLMLWTLHKLCIRKGTSAHCLINYEHRERRTILKIKNSKGAHTIFWRNQVNGAIQEVSYVILIICKNNIQWLDKGIKSQEKDLKPTR